MSSRTRSGFTLIEVMAAVLVLGLLYTVLASAAMRGLRSEGTDRRRADAEMIADLEITTIETELASGVPLEDGPAEHEEEIFKVSSNVEPFDVLSLLPAPLHAEIARGSDSKAPSVLHDERGQSRVRRISVVVEWDEAGEPDSVERTTFAFDTSVLEQYFASAPATGDKEGAAGIPDEELPPALRGLTPGGPAPKSTRRSGRSDPSR